MTSRAALLRTAAVLLYVLAPVPAGAMTLPYGFTDTPLPYTFDTPTSLALLPSGRVLVGEKAGDVWIVDAGERHLLWSGEDEVANLGDVGLVGLAVDPHFATNHRLYFFYTVDPDSDGNDYDGPPANFGRLVRFTMSATDSNALDPDSRTVLMGTTWSDGWPTGSYAHHVDDIAWGTDGTMLLSAGEGSHFLAADAGGLDPDLFAPGRIDPAQDIGAFRARMLGSLGGKVLRVDPETGLGLPSNPFFDGDPASAASRVWSYGLRNPFRITVRPGTGATDPALGNPGTLYIGDVGWNTWEELDVARDPGMNFGWPCIEGPFVNLPYVNATPSHDGCSSSSNAPETAPLLAFHHVYAAQSQPPGVTGSVIAGGVFLGAPWPAAYRGTYVFGDYGAGWIRMLRTDALDRIVQTEELVPDADGPVDFATDPVDGDLWFVSIFTGVVHRLSFTGSVGVGPRGDGGFALAGPIPNPAARGVRLALTLPVASDTRLEIVDVTGRRVWSGGTSRLTPGVHALEWPGTTGGGFHARPGLYFARVVAGTRVLVRRVTIVE
jgi:glucose/arabinose dehydrogenase